MGRAIVFVHKKTCFLDADRDSGGFSNNGEGPGMSGHCGDNHAIPSYSAALSDRTTDRTDRWEQQCSASADGGSQGHREKAPT